MTSVRIVVIMLYDHISKQLMLIVGLDIESTGLLIHLPDVDAE